MSFITLNDHDNTTSAVESNLTVRITGLDGEELLFKNYKCAINDQGKISSFCSPDANGNQPDEELNELSIEKLGNELLIQELRDPFFWSVKILHMETQLSPTDTILEVLNGEIPILNSSLSRSSTITSDSDSFPNSNADMDLLSQGQLLDLQAIRVEHYRKPFSDGDELKQAIVECFDPYGSSSQEAKDKRDAAIQKYGDIRLWDVSQVTDMDYLFSGNYSFNEDLSRWDVGSVTTMSHMFSGASAFSGDLSRWSVKNVTDMSWMFFGASNFTSDLSRWQVENVTEMSLMFCDASNFNSDLSQWSVGNVTDMYKMFDGAYNFNSDLSQWSVGNVTDMFCMFRDAKNFNGDLSQWSVGNVLSMVKMFCGASSFNSDLSQWSVGNVCSMFKMFKDAINFRSDLSQWRVKNVCNMNRMFLNVSYFESDLSQWPKKLPKRKLRKRKSWCKYF